MKPGNERVRVRNPQASAARRKESDTRVVIRKNHEINALYNDEVVKLLVCKSDRQFKAQCENQKIKEVDGYTLLSTLFANLEKINKESHKIAKTVEIISSPTKPNGNSEFALLKGKISELERQIHNSMDHANKENRDEQHQSPPGANTKVRFNLTDAEPSATSPQKSALKNKQEAMTKQKQNTLQDLIKLFGGQKVYKDELKKLVADQECNNQDEVYNHLLEAIKQKDPNFAPNKMVFLKLKDIAKNIFEERQKVWGDNDLGFADIDAVVLPKDSQIVQSAEEKHDDVVEKKVEEVVVQVKQEIPVNPDNRELRAQFRKDDDGYVKPKNANPANSRPDPKKEFSGLTGGFFNPPQSKKEDLTKQAAPKPQEVFNLPNLSSDERDAVGVPLDDSQECPEVSQVEENIDHENLVVNPKQNVADQKSESEDVVEKNSSEKSSVKGQEPIVNDVKAPQNFGGLKSGFLNVKQQDEAPQDPQEKKVYGRVEGFDEYVRREGLEDQQDQRHQDPQQNANKSGLWNFISSHKVLFGAGLFIATSAAVAFDLSRENSLLKNVLFANVRSFCSGIKEMFVGSPKDGVSR